jgi:hypothetical protein
MAITLRSDAFENGRPIPKKYSGEGEDVSPPLSWNGAPPEAKQLVLICDDPDAPRDEPWVHWLIYNIPPSVKQLPEAVKAAESPAEPTQTAQGENSWGRIGYGGPMPPPGHGTHHYHFRLYATSVEPTLEPGLTKEKLLDAVGDQVLDEGELIGTYER